MSDYRNAVVEGTCAGCGEVFALVALAQMPTGHLVCEACEQFSDDAHGSTLESRDVSEGGD